MFVSNWLLDKSNYLAQIFILLILFPSFPLHNGGIVSYECQTSTVKIQQAVL